MATPLLGTKLYIPPVRPELVPRPRLIERLRAGLDRRLTLLSAPAGFGKTTLLSQCIAHCDPRPRFAWLSLGQGDNDPARFWIYVVAALQTMQPDLGETIVAAFQAAQPPPIEGLLTGLINEIAAAGSERFVLVLDDFHLIAEPRIHKGLVFLLDNLPPPPGGFHLIISSRTDLPWPIARLRARGELTELRPADLRFTSEEVSAFLNDAVGLGLSPENVAALDARTEGWIAGLQMAALAIQALARQASSMRERKQSQGAHGLSAFIQTLTASHRFILDYLVEEVLDQQSPAIQEFLLQTSILEQMTASLCDAVTGGEESQAILDQLEQANLFLISLDDERRWYRYHHLFADLLRSRLEQASSRGSAGAGQPDQVLALHRQASAWYEQNKLIAEAVSHALAAGDVKRVADLAEGNALAMMDHGELTTLVGWLNALPEEVVRSQPWLCVTYAWALVYGGQLDVVEPRLRDAEKALVQQRSPGCVRDGFEEDAKADAEGAVLSPTVPRMSKDEAKAHHIVGHIAAIRAYVADLRGDKPREAELARKALEHLPKEDLRARGVAMSLLVTSLYWSGDLASAAQLSAEAIAVSQASGDSHVSVRVLCELAALQLAQGQLRKAVAICQDALGLADEHSRRSGWRLPATGFAHTLLSSALREWNDLETALRHAREAVELCMKWGQAEDLIQGYVCLARVLQAIGDLDGALDAIQEATQVASGVSPYYVGYATAHQARLYLAQGDGDPRHLAAAIRWAQESGLNMDDELAFHREHEYVTLVRVLIAQAKEPSKGLLIDDALRWLAWLLKAAEATGAMGRVIEILILQAVALQAQGKGDQALAALERTLSLAEPERYVRTFIDEGAPIAELLREAARTGVAVRYADKLLAALDGETQQRGPNARERTTAPTQRNCKEPLPLVESLSEREKQVLRLLDTRLSAPEVAEELVISRHTVRTHIKHIYGKLSVHNREDAVQRARELGLL